MKTNPFLRNLFLLLTCLAFAWSACSDDDPEPDPVLSVSKQDVNFEASPAATQTVNVTANLAWSVSVTQTGNWLNVTPNSGEGNGTVSITATANEGSENRTAVITISGKNVDPVTINVSQLAPEIIPALSTSITSLNIEPVQEASQSIAVSSNVTWSAVITQTDDWLSINPASGTGNATVSVTATDNNTGEDRSAVITLSADGVPSVTINVSQSALPELSVSKESIDFQNAGEAVQTFDVTANVAWSIAIEQTGDWLSVDPVSGNGNATISVTAVFNPGEERQATLTISGDGVAPVIIFVMQEENEDEDITDKIIDPVFRAYCLTNFDANSNGRLTAKEAALVKVIIVPSSGISSLEGVEYFTALSTLLCYDNNLTELDVSRNTALKDLNCNTNSLTNLDVSQNTALEQLSFYNNELIGINISQNIALTYIFCSANDLENLDIRRNTALKNLECSNNNLTELDVSQNTVLEKLSLGNNKLTSLDISKNTALKELICSNNSLTALDVTQNAALINLYCFDNNFTSLDVSQNTALTYLQCSNNKLISLDVSQNKALVTLSCSGNSLTGLDVKQNTVLESFDCSGNNLTDLDISKNTELTYLYCIGNPISIIRVWSGFDSSQYPRFTKPAGAVYEIVQ